MTDSSRFFGLTTTGADQRALLFEDGGEREVNRSHYYHNVFSSLSIIATKELEEWILGY